MARNPKPGRENGYRYSEAGGQPRVRATRDLAMDTTYEQKVVPFMIKKAV